MFSITHYKGKKCTNVYPFESKEYSIGKKLLGRDWEKIVFWSLFASASTLFVALIFTNIYLCRTKFGAFEKEKKLNKVKCKNALFVSIGKSQSNGHYMGWLISWVIQKHAFFLLLLLTGRIYWVSWPYRYCFWQIFKFVKSKSVSKVFLLKVLIRTGGIGSFFLFALEIYSLFWYI